MVPVTWGGIAYEVVKVRRDVRCRCPQQTLVFVPRPRWSTGGARSTRSWSEVWLESCGEVEITSASLRTMRRRLGINSLVEEFLECSRQPLSPSYITVNLVYNSVLVETTATQYLPAEEAPLDRATRPPDHSEKVPSAGQKPQLWLCNSIWRTLRL